MTNPFIDLAAFDRVIHEPARLSILTVLSVCQEADFMFLQRTTGLTKGNLSGHLKRLEDEGMVAVVKRFDGRTPQTIAKLSDEGRTRLTQHWALLEDLKRESEKWRPGSMASARAITGH
jgi:DNA-binding transcriptional ArsR family regulator